MELIAGPVWKILFVGPENKLFAQFKQTWKDIDKELPDSHRPTVMLVALLSSEDSSTLFSRDDYRGCVENTLIIFGETPPRGVHFLKPGAIHQSRWMTNNLHDRKMFIFSETMLYDHEMVEK